MTFRTVEITVANGRRHDGRQYAVCFNGDEPIEVRVRQTSHRAAWYTIWMHGEPFTNRIAMDVIKAARAA